MHPDERDRTRDRRGVRLALGGVVLLFVGLYLAGHFLIGDRLPVGTRVEGIGIGAMTPADARATLEERLAERAAEPITLVRGEQTFEIKAEEAGLSYDAAETVENAGGGSTWNPWQMLQVVIGNQSVEAVVATDADALRRAGAKIAAAVDKPAVEPQITFAGTEPVVREPRSGTAVDTAATEQLITDRYLGNRGATMVPVSDVDPKVGDGALKATMRDFARLAVSGPISIAVGNDMLTLAVADFTPALTVSVEGGELVPTVDAEKLEKPLNRAVAESGGLGDEARDATVRLADGRPVVVPARAGVDISPDDVAEGLLPALTKSGADRTIDIDPQRVAPDVTTKDARQLGITEKVSTFTTRFPYAEYRNINQGRAAELINGTVLAPGDTFSFNGTVGERTKANGFTVGTIIADGVFREELGGGVSQVATTTYNAAFFAGLEDIEHNPHSFYIDRYPVGREATVAWPDVDLQVGNDTEYGVLIEAKVTPSTPSSEGAMTVSMWSTKTWTIEAGVSDRSNSRAPGLIYDASDRCVPQTGVAGFDVTVYRTFLRGGEQVRRESIPASYAAADTVLCQEDPNTEGQGGGTR